MKTNILQDFHIYISVSVSLCFVYLTIVCLVHYKEVFIAIYLYSILPGKKKVKCDSRDPTFVRVLYQMVINGVRLLHLLFGIVGTRHQDATYQKKQRTG